DTESEKLVQDALDKSTLNRTTITIAHRLSTIKDSDMIYVFGKGQIIESGTHAELVEMEGAYASLVKAQDLKKIKGDSTGNKSEPQESIQLEKKLIDITQEVGLQSGSSLCSKDTNEKKKKQGSYRDYIWVIKKYSAQSRLFIPGVFISIADGFLVPAFAVAFSKMLTSFGNPDAAKQKSETNFYALLFFLFAVATYITLGLRTYTFGRSAVKVNIRLKKDMFAHIVYQDSEFFDQKANGSGTLTSRLASEPEDIYLVNSDALPLFFSALGCLVTSVVIGFVRSWMLTLAILAVIPSIAFAQSQRSKGMMNAVKKSKTAQELAAQEVAESISNIKTVTSLSRENTLISNYVQSNVSPHKATLKGYYINGLLYAFSTASMYLVYALSFYAGSKFVIAGYINTSQMLDTLYSIMFGAVGLGRCSNAVGMLPKALNSSSRIRELFGTEPKIAALTKESQEHKSILPSELKGDIKADDVSFSYPTRPDVRALKHVNVNAAPGQTIALVGSSGSGKSTIINLILRLYDVSDGSVSVDSVDVRDWPLDKLRDHPSLVSQEPILFDCSASENIKYGKPDATEFEVQQAAKAANIHNLLMDLPDGYNTRVGGKGSMLSGGQKQRIAIARALIRNPKILLLDEATSALDTESEKVVQYALDKASV
ncbi:Multidrug resistance protein 1A, partial [Zancudomyces culisetae]